MDYSKYQLDIFAAVEAGERNVMVNALAGSGKTTTSEHAMKRIPRGQTILALAFNKSIAEELQRRIPDGAVAATLNSVGHRAWMAAYRGTKLDGQKVRGIAQKVVPFAEREITADVISLVQKAKVHGIVPNNVIGVTKAPVTPLMADTDENWLAIADRYNITLPWQYSRVLNYARSVLGQSVTNTSVIDFDDQLYMSVIYNVRFPSFDRIMVDEAQDLSDIHIEMVKRLGTPESRYLFVGDRNQSLYAFRGADSKAMERLSKEFNCVELPLSVTYRCPTLVVEQAKRFVPRIEARPGAPTGVVRQSGSYFDEDYQPGDMVICRRQLPVITLAYALIARKVKCRVQGRDLAEGLKSLVRKLKARSVEDLLTKVGDWEKRQIGLLTAAEEEHKIEAVMDKANTLRIIATSSGATTIEGIEAEIESLFSGDGPCVLLSTIHRVKGLESDRVFVIDNDHTPRWAANSPEQMQQELNIKYVAITRAKQELVFVTTAPSKNKNDLKAQVLGAKVESMVGATYLSAISAAPDNAPEQVMNATDEQLLAVHDRK